MNVNDYSKEELLKIIGLEIDYEPSVYLINTKINSLIERMQQEGKTKFVSFFENIRLKLLRNNHHKELGNNALEFSKNFNWNKIVKRYVELI